MMQEEAYVGACPVSCYLYNPVTIEPAHTSLLDNEEHVVKAFLFFQLILSQLPDMLVRML